MVAMSPAIRRRIGFTLIELMVVLLVIALLATLVAPRVLGQLARAKEETLQHNLQEIRQAIDKHVADTGRYPQSLQALVEKRYLRKLPIDPLTGRADTWELATASDGGGVADVHSGEKGNGSDGTPYSSW
jgi:general secretion pathway protein G